MVQLKKKVTLRQKTAPSPINLEKSAAPAPPRRRWTWVAAVALVAVAVGGYLAFTPHETEQQPVAPLVAATDSTADSTPDSTTEQAAPVPEASASGEQPLTEQDIEKMANDVWRGNYGNNPDRRRNLGARYTEVQSRVNEMRRLGLR